MDSDVLVILDTLNVSNHLKDLYILGSSPRNKQKLLLKILCEKEIDCLCTDVKRILSFVSDKTKTHNTKNKLKIKCFVASSYMLFGIIYMFDSKAADLLDTIEQSILGKQKQEKSLRCLHSKKRSDISSAEINVPESQGYVIDLDFELLESLSRKSLSKMLQESGNSVRDETSITIVEEDDLIRNDTDTTSDLNIEFLTKFCDGNIQAMKKLQNSWSSAGPSMLQLSEQNQLSVPDSLEWHGDRTDVSDTSVECPSFRSIIESFVQDCSDPVNLSNESISVVLPRRSRSFNIENQSIEFSRRVIKKRMMRYLQKVHDKFSNLAIHDDLEVPMLIKIESVEREVFNVQHSDSNLADNCTSVLNKSTLPSTSVTERNASVPKSLSTVVCLRGQQTGAAQRSAPQDWQQHRAEINSENDIPDNTSMSSLNISHTSDLPTGNLSVESLSNMMELSAHYGSLSNIHVVEQFDTDLPAVFPINTTGIFTDRESELNDYALPALIDTHINQFSTKNSSTTVDTVGAVVTTVDSMAAEAPTTHTVTAATTTTRTVADRVQLHKKRDRQYLYTDLKGNPKKRRIRKQLPTEQIPITSILSEVNLQGDDEHLEIAHNTEVSLNEVNYPMAAVNTVMSLTNAEGPVHIAQEVDLHLDTKTSCTTVWTQKLLLQRLKILKVENGRAVTFSQLCNQSKSRKEVARTFSLLLCMAAKRLIKIDQTRPNDPDYIYIHLSSSSNGFSEDISEYNK